MATGYALIIEDDIALSEMFAIILQAQGVETAVVRDGAAVLKKIHARIPDIILLDMHLPNLSGIRILEHIREDARIKHVQVVVVTANAQLASACEDKADLVLLKPVSYEQLSGLSLRFIKLATQEVRALKLDDDSAK
jgi:CheY-like chemotaxis protein